MVERFCDQYSLLNQVGSPSALINTLLQKTMAIPDEYLFVSYSYLGGKQAL